jgi:Flp pilus assembly protein TadG
LWLIVALPVLLLLACLLVEIGNIWLARAELENAMEAAALAAVKEWGDRGGGDTEMPREVGVAYAEANPVTGVPPAPFLSNRDGGDSPNQNEDCTGNLVFGAVTNAAVPYEFNAGVQPSCSGAPFAVRARATVPVQSIGGRLSGMNWGMFSVSASAVAMYDCTTGRPRLIRVRPEDIVCPGP